ncbi:MAG: FHA domain-containing protein [Bdellovibrionales bacterium]|nr:FHA domain-containing protein [Bdellovibrionales bacterium]
MPKLLIKLPNGMETSFHTQEDDIFIGRIPSINDVCVNHPSISRQHAHIKKRDEGYTIYDLKSLNGLYVNDKRVARAVLSHGDIIRLGDVSVEIGLNEKSSAQTAQEIEDFEPTRVGMDIPQLKK